MFSHLPDSCSFQEYYDATNGAAANCGVENDGFADTRECNDNDEGTCMGARELILMRCAFSRELTEDDEAAFKSAFDQGNAPVLEALEELKMTKPLGDGWALKLHFGGSGPIGTLPYTSSTCVLDLSVDMQRGVGSCDMNHSVCEGLQMTRQTIHWFLSMLSVMSTTSSK